MRSAFERAEDVTPEGGAPRGGEHGGGEPPHVDYGAPSPAVGAEFPLNDYGNGQRLLHYYGKDMLFVPRLGWYR